MKRSKAMNIKKIFFISLTILVLAFIWINSSFDSVESSGLSGGVLGFVNDILMNIGIKRELSEHIIRKTAHFTEYALLGTLLAIDCFLFILHIKDICMITLFSGLVTALIDETIQLFPEGRSSLVTDVWLDFSGIGAGLILSLFIHRLYIKRRNCRD